MRNVPLHVFALLAVMAPFIACAAGDVSPDVGPGPVTPQSDNGDSGGGGITLDDAATPVTNPAPGDDAGSALPPASDDAGSTPPSDDASPTTTVDSASPSPPPPSPVDSGTAASCPGYAPPTTPAGCTCNPAIHPCTANGCYSGYYCELSALKCVTKPAGC